MANLKLPIQELIKELDRLPVWEQGVAMWEETFAKLAGFYGFEKCVPSLIEDARHFLPLAKFDLLGERPPLMCRLRQGGEVMLRSSMALSLVRAVQAHKMYEQGASLKLFSMGESFFAQATLPFASIREETLLIMGEEGPIAEAELIQILWKAFTERGVDMEKMKLVLNATGCTQCRPQFRSVFLPYVRNRASRLCKDCKKFLKQRPTRILSCAEEKCKMVAHHAPQILDFLCDPCKKQLRGLLEFLDEGRIPYFLDAKLFREGTWFSMSTFVMVGDGVALLGEAEGGSASLLSLSPSPYGHGRVLCAEGGRMGRAAELLMGRPTSVVTATLFPDIAHRLFTHTHQGSFTVSSAEVFLIQLGELAKRKSLFLLESLRQGGIQTRESLGRDSIKSQLRAAERTGVGIALILGQKEALDGTVIVRETSSGIQETVPQEKLIDLLKRKLKK